jgi:hypothetical protein
MPEEIVMKNVAEIRRLLDEIEASYGSEGEAEGPPPSERPLMEGGYDTPPMGGGLPPMEPRGPSAPRKIMPF